MNNWLEDCQAFRNSIYGAWRQLCRSIYRAFSNKDAVGVLDATDNNWRQTDFIE